MHVLIWHNMAPYDSPPKSDKIATISFDMYPLVIHVPKQFIGDVNATIHNICYVLFVSQKGIA